MRLVRIVVLLVVVAGIAPGARVEPVPWWQADWTHRRVVQPTGPWCRVPFEPAVARGRFAAQPESRRLPHWTQTVETSAPRPVAADPDVHYGFPRLVRTHDDRLLLFYRVGTSHASDPAAIALRSSPDDGATWSDQRIIHRDPDGYCAHNPVPVVAPDGRVILFVSSYHWRGGAKLPMYWSHSDDHGRSWAPFVKFDLDPTRSTYYMTDAIVTDDGLLGMSTGFAPDGRTEAHNLLWHSPEGRSWRVRSTVTRPSENLGDEVTMLPTGDGSLTVLLRDRRGRTTWRLRTEDAGRTWSEREDLGPQVEILQRPYLTRLTPSVVLLTGRDRKRALIVVYVSRDGGENFAERHVIDRFYGDGGYTAGLRLSDRRALLVYYADGPESRGKPDLRQVTIDVLDAPRYVCFRAAPEGTTYLYTRPGAAEPTQDRTYAWTSPPEGWSEATLSRQLEARGTIPLLGPATWEGGYSGGALPEAADPPWEVLGKGRARVSLAEGGALRICDEGDGAGELIHASRDWELTPEGNAEIDVCLRVLSCTGPGGCMLRVADGEHEEVFTFFPDRVFTNRSGRSAAVDLASEFATLRVTVGGDDFAVWQGDRVLIDGRGLFAAPAYRGRRVVQFGSGSSAARGEALWKSLDYRICQPR
jgi:hypothetical protein